MINRYSLHSEEARLIILMVIKRPGVKLYKPYYRVVKRILEIIICLVTAPILAPLGLLIALIIRADSSGPALFIQERIGKGAKKFKMIKFRTMHQNIDSAAHQAYMRKFVKGKFEGDNQNQVFKPFTANQVTRVGRILRKTSLDELPQLINVFKGEMSLIGPRPNVAWEVEEYLGWHMERLEVPPGITGLAQVRGRSGISFDEIVQHDIEYIKKQSLLLDTKILWWTVASVIFGKGAQ